MVRATSCAAALRRTRRSLPLPVLLLPVLVLGASALLVPVRLHAQDPDSRYEPGFFEIAAERLPGLIVPVLVDSAGSVLLPLETVARFLGFALEPGADVWQVPRLEGGSARLELATRTLRTPRDSLVLAPAELVRTDADLFLRSERLAQLFEADVSVDFGRLLVTFTRATRFPAQQRIELEQRRSVLQPRSSPAGRSGLRESTASGVGIADWEIATNGFDPTSLTTGRLQLGTALLGGGLSAAARFEAGRLGGERIRDTALRYHRAFTSSRWIAQAEAGDILTHGMFARFVRGAELTNAPYHRGYELGEVALRPELPPGWQYEVVQGNQLLGYSEGDGRAPVSVPLRLGATPVEVRMYGPAGEELVQRLVYQTPVTMLQRGRIEYTLGGGVCPADACDGYGHGDLRWGALGVLTLGTGAELFADSTGRDFRPYALASFTTGTQLVGELQLMPGALYRANLAGYFDARTSARLHADLSRPGYGRLAAVAEAGHRYDLDGWLERRIGARGGGTRQLRVNVGALGRTEGVLERWRVGAQLVNARGLAELRFDAASLGRDLVTARVGRVLDVGRSGRLRPALQGAVAGSRIGVEILEAGASVQPLPFANLATTVRWSRDVGASVSLGWSSRLGPVQSTARLAAAEQTDPSSTFALSGSALFAPGGGVHGESLTRVGYGGVRGTAFLDHDDDGVLGPGDTPLPDLPLIIAGAPARTDARGRYVHWGLLPYTDAQVVVDSLRVADPALALGRPGTLVRIVPNTAVRLDVPLVQTRELAGAIQAGRGIVTTAGLTVLLTADDGRVVEATTFSDGSFYVSRLRPGTYTLTIAPSSLAALAAAAPAPLGFELAGEVEMLELEPLVLERADAAGR